METTTHTGGYKVKLENYEGPLDLLLHLVRKGDMDIMDIPIARLTADYLAYLEFMQSVNIDTAGTFALMAAQLVHLKSRALLPKPPEEEAGEEEEDPRQAIAQPLLDYMKVKDAAEMLQRREMLGRDVFVRAFPEPEGDEEDVAAGISQASVFDLLDAFRAVLASRQEEEPLLLEVEADSVAERMGRLARVIARHGGIAFVALFPAAVSRREIIITFLALLEMVKGGLVRVIQDEAGNFSVLPPLAGVA